GAAAGFMQASDPSLSGWLFHWETEPRKSVGISSAAPKTRSMHKDAAPGDVPSFRVNQPKIGLLNNVPVPDAPFGLDYHGMPVGDVHVKGLSRLTSLQVLDLGKTKVTDATLKEVAVLTKLQTLRLDCPQVTDKGIKLLADLKNVQTLYLGGTGIT